MSKFTIIADTPGEYFFIPYKSLSLLGKTDTQMGKIIERNRQFIKDHGGVPWCDFKMYRGRKKMDLNLVFMQCLRRIIVLNKQKRSDIIRHKQAIDELHFTNNNSQKKNDSRMH